MLVNAAVLSAKNIADEWETATSNDRAANGWIWASACSNETLVSPSRTALSRATRSIAADRSTPRAEPLVAMRAASRVVRPVPHPTSRTLESRSTAAAAVNDGS